MNVKSVTEEMQVLPLGSAEELAVADAVVTAAAAPAGATHAFLGTKTATVFVGFGRDPADSGAGLPLAANTIRLWRKEAVAQARFIQGAGTAGVVSIEWVTLQG